MTKRPILYRFYESPYGKMLIGSIDGKLCICDWTDSRRHESNKRRLCEKLNAAFQPGECEENNIAVQELNEYFAGSRQSFNIPTISVGTTLQISVWKELSKIPYGSTTTYAAISMQCGIPKGVRAVANAIGSNPLSIIVPCHRVIGASGSLTGYAGGLDAKRGLLEFESQIARTI